MKKNIMIIGGTSDIGRSLISKLGQNNNIYTTYNCSSINALNIKSSFKLDILNHQSWEDISKWLESINIKFDLVISCVGTLSGENPRPEKSLKDISLDQLKEVFSINSFYAPMLAKSLKKYLSKEDSMRFVFLSAMVGSINENSLGGWYSYRASKTALNMFVKNIAIELKRLKFKGKVLSVHPGTTKTKLSKDHLSGVKHKIWTPDETAQNILKVIYETNLETGSFLNWDGRRIDW